MRNIQARILALLLAALMLLGLTACGEEIAGLTENVFSEPGITETAVSEETPDEPELPDAPEADPGTSDSAVTEGEYYYDLDHVVLYLDRYGVPSRTTYITKDEARALSAGRAAASKTNSIARPSAATGSATAKACSRKAAGRSYTECDIDTDGQSSRGAKRLVFSNDGLYFYTE